MRGDALHDVCDISLGVDIVQLSCLDNRENRSRTITASDRAREQPIPSAYREVSQ